MCWKANNERFLLVLVLAPEPSGIMLCGHNKVLCHQFGPCQALYRVGPLAHVEGAPSLAAPNPRMPLWGINSVAAILVRRFC